MKKVEILGKEFELGIMNRDYTALLNSVFLLNKYGEDYWKFMKKYAGKVFGMDKDNNRIDDYIDDKFGTRNVTTTKTFKKEDEEDK